MTEPSDNLRNRLELADDLDQPGFQYSPLVGRHLCKGHAHPESRVNVDYFGFGFEDALIPEDP